MDKVLYIEGEVLSQPMWFSDSCKRSKRGLSISLVIHFGDGDIEQDNGQSGGRIVL